MWRRLVHAWRMFWIARRHDNAIYTLVMHAEKSGNWEPAESHIARCRRCKELFR